jgi:hypothetical protein
MNRQLIQTYRFLTNTEKQSIRKSLSGQGLVLKLMDFLDTCTNENFFNSEAVSYLYGPISDNYKIAENRYYKLRKKLMESLQIQNMSQPSESLFHRYEIEFKTLQKSIRDGQVMKNYSKLETLVNQLWKDNLFELLPEALDTLILANQTFNRLEKNQDLHLSFERALQLHADMFKALNLARKVYEYNFTKGMKAAQVYLSDLKLIATKNKDFDRFRYCYEFASAYYKLGSREYVNAMNIVGRHLNKVWALHNKNPQMPLFNFRVNYEAGQRFHLLEIRAFYLYNTCNFKPSYDTYRQILNEPTNAKSQLGLVNETTYINAIRGALASELPKEALDYCRKLEQFQTANQQRKGYNPVSMVYLQLYLDYQIELKDKAPLSLYEQLQNDISFLQQTDNRVFLGDALLLDLKWKIVNGNLTGAENLVDEPILGEALFNDQGLKNLLKEAIQYFKKDPAERNFLPLERQINKQRLKELHPQKVFLLRWLKKLVGKGGIGKEG